MQLYKFLLKTKDTLLSERSFMIKRGGWWWVVAHLLGLRVLSIPIFHFPSPKSQVPSPRSQVPGPKSQVPSPSPSCLTMMKTLKEKLIHSNFDHFRLFFGVVGSYCFYWFYGIKFSPTPKNNNLYKNFT